MFSFFSSKDTKNTPSLADRIHGTPVMEQSAVQQKTAASQKPVAEAGQQDIRAAYLDEHELNASHLKQLCDVAQGPALVLGFISPDLSMDSVAQSIKRELPNSAKLILMTTSGELCRAPRSPRRTRQDSVAIIFPPHDRGYLYHEHPSS